MARRYRSPNEPGRHHPHDSGMYYARMVAKFNPAGRRMDFEEKRAWRKQRLLDVLHRHGLSWHDRYWDVLTEAGIREEDRKDHARYVRAYGSSRDPRRVGRDSAHTVWTVQWKVGDHWGAPANEKTFHDKGAARRFMREIQRRRSVHSVKLKPWRWSATEQRRSRIRRR